MKITLLFKGLLVSFDLNITDGDLVINADGSIKTISDTPKLRQDIIKIVLTTIGSNRFHPWYGCSVGRDSIGQVLSADILFFSQIQASVSESIKRLKALQASQASTQNVSLAELISEIGLVDAGRNPIDPRQIDIIINVFTKRLTRVEELFTIIS